MKIYFATGNHNKKKEFTELINNYKTMIPIMADFIDLETEENGNTYEENSKIKANALLKYIKNNDTILDKKYIIIADDSGFEFDALDGKPGIYTHRYIKSKGPENALNEVIILIDLDVYINHV